MPLSKLAQYDMVLAVSQDAINTQWSHLYHTTIGNSAEEGYLLPHELDIETDDASIKGIILPPRVDFNDITTAAVAYRTVRLNFKFTEALNTSFFSTSIIKKDPQTHRPTVEEVNEDVHGWTFSFEAGIGRADIQKILEDGLKAGTAAALKPYVPSKTVSSVDFLASSIFCLFETSQIVKSVRILDADGKEPSDDKVTAFTVALIKQFTKMNDDATEAGKHPYVMGYVVHQTPTHTVNPSEMVPKSFQMSTTTDKTDFSTINFLMLQTQDPLQDPNAGLFSQTFFSKIHQTTHNGVLGMSFDIFVNKFILPHVVPEFKQKPMVNKTIESQSSSSFDFENGKVAWTDTWVAETTREDAGLWWRKWSFNGTVRTEITYSSLAQDDPNAAAKDDSKHVLTMRVSQEHKSYCEMYTSPHFHVDDDWKSWGNWADAIAANLTIPIEVVFIISPGEDGQLNAEYRQDLSKFPAMDKQVLKTKVVLFGEDPQPGDNSTPIYASISGFYEVDKALSIIDSLLTPLFSSSISSMVDSVFKFNVGNIGTQLPTLKDKIIMPAGDVLTFASLDSDSDGHVYCGIDYRALSNGQVKTT